MIYTFEYLDRKYLDQNGTDTDRHNDTWHGSVSLRPNRMRDNVEGNGR